jgi:hypothetical protein
MIVNAFHDLINLISLIRLKHHIHDRVNQIVIIMIRVNIIRERFPTISKVVSNVRYQFLNLISNRSGCENLSMTGFWHRYQSSSFVISGRCWSGWSNIPQYLWSIPWWYCCNIVAISLYTIEESMLYSAFAISPIIEDKITVWHPSFPILFLTEHLWLNANDRLLIHQRNTSPIKLDWYEVQNLAFCSSNSSIVSTNSEIPHQFGINL